ncbi:nuclease-related domain-containing protein [Halobacillus amylolyticus]|uniref:NERD domain-containing protein n=1 Tax=Halobacillus amylolyticus TaxID=2932259 RepID=A0ABY4HG09_9BACI|nr:nuclease-related domain-containing protein [Halobacillus amylolyticus]UOR13855.1 NERD domain-containing protein [Halobacillus amylolyticus]
MKTTQHKQLASLLGRLPLAHSKRSDVQEQYSIRSAGHSGETTADHFLQYLHSEEYHVIQDIRLFDGIQHFQIDCLVLTPFFLLILEVKNFRGKLIFDFEHHQLFRIFEGKKETFPDPFLQVEHQSYQLKMWLDQFNFPEIPTHSFVVVTNPKTVIKTHGPDPEGRKRRIIRPKQSPSSVTSLTSVFNRKYWDFPQIKTAASRFKKENHASSRPYSRKV